MLSIGAPASQQYWLVPAKFTWSWPRMPDPLLRTIRTPSPPPPVLPPPGLIVTWGAPSWLLPADAAGAKTSVIGAATRAARVNSTVARPARRGRLSLLVLFGGPSDRWCARRGIMACSLLSEREHSRCAVVLPHRARNHAKR